MKLSKLIKSALKTAIYVMDQTADQVERVSDRANELADNARDTLSMHESHPLRNFLSFAAGVGVGVGVGMLLAPSSGAELRDTITDKVQDIGNRVAGRGENYATGTDMR